ncbi:MAG: carboxypeptidase-like regulatory domain-containing protein, partial [Bacteroidota bacterium]
MKRSYLLVFFMLLTIFQATAQVTISGTVKDKKNKSPIVGANIYVHQSQIGTVSDINGKFTLRIPKKLKTIVFISFIGYKTIQRTIKQESGEIKLDFLLEEDQIRLSEYEVATNPDKKWEKNLRRFERLFLGNDRLSRSCKILNPWVLEFEYEGRIFRARTNQVLMIENGATGYMTAFKLNRFFLEKGILVYDGLISFEEMTHNDEKELKDWQYNRRLAYGGSLRHFFQSAINDKAKQNGFSAVLLNPYFSVIKTVYRAEELNNLQINENVSPDKIFKKVGDKRMLSFSRRLRIFYYGDIQGERVQLSDIELKNEVFIDQNGMLESPTAVVTYGQMAKENFAYLLPEEYQYIPNEEGLFEFNNQIAKPFENYAASHPTEQLYLHTDKGQYVDGEEIWFKAYANIDKKPSPVASKLYVLLLHKGQTIAKHVVPVQDGLAYGSLTVPDKVDEGEYLIKAYTNWSDTLSDAYHFYKKIRIGLSQSTLKQRKNPFSLKVFPEGGHLIEGNENKVAFELTSNQRQYVNTTLELINDEFEVVQTIFPTWQGKGTFVFTPEEKKSYALRMKSRRAVSVDLSPTIGLTTNMMIRDMQTHLDVRIQSNKPKQATYYLLTTAGDRIVNIRTFSLKGEDFINLPKTDLADGVNQLTLFDKDYRPLAERLYFKYPTVRSDITIRLGKHQSLKRESAEVIIKGKDKVRSASLSVSNVDLFGYEPSENIWVSTYLRPHLSGNIIGLDPAFAKTETLRRQLDLLMLTNGWRRYNWDIIRQKKTLLTDTIDFQNGLDITGTLTKGNQRLPVSGEALFLVKSDTASSIHQALTDENGRFTFENVIYNDSSDLLLRLVSNKYKPSNLHFTFDTIKWSSKVAYLDFFPAGEPQPNEPAMLSKQQ